MKSIHKYLIVPDGVTEMPVGAQILSVGEQRDAIYAWALVDVDAPMTTRYLVAVPTGYRFEDNAAPKLEQFLGTVQNRDGLVFHIFDASEQPKWVS